jgi:FAST kinase-like protein, subdomain 1
MLDVDWRGVTRPELLVLPLGRSLSAWTPKELCSVLWSLGRLGFHPGAPILDNAIDGLSVHAPSLSLRHLVNAVNGLAMLNHRPPRQMLAMLEDRLCDELLQVRPWLAVWLVGGRCA